jgi:inosine-uridine nucleoside N-ribohydrolase
MQKDKSFASNLKKLFVLGGSFFSSGNVNPAAEANVSHMQESEIPSPSKQLN